MKKEVGIDKRAHRDLSKFPMRVQEDFDALIRDLAKFGRLGHPVGEKLAGTRSLFEMKVKMRGEWRGIYSYVGNEVIVLHFFRKKTQKTPRIEIGLAERRLRDWVI